jgi:hypothetical protein
MNYCGFELPSPAAASPPPCAYYMQPTTVASNHYYPWSLGYVHSQVRLLSLPLVQNMLPSAVLSFALELPGCTLNPMSAP